MKKKAKISSKRVGKKSWYNLLPFKFTVVSVTFLGCLALVAGALYTVLPQGSDVLGTNTKASIVGTFVFVHLATNTGKSYTVPSIPNSSGLFCIDFYDGPSPVYPAPADGSNCTHTLPANIRLIYPSNAHVSPGENVVIKGGFAQSNIVGTIHATPSLPYSPGAGRCDSPSVLSPACTMTVNLPTLPVTNTMYLFVKTIPSGYKLPDKNVSFCVDLFDGSRYVDNTKGGTNCSNDLTKPFIVTYLSSVTSASVNGGWGVTGSTSFQFPAKLSPLPFKQGMCTNKKATPGCTFTMTIPSVGLSQTSSTSKSSPVTVPPQRATVGKTTQY